MNKKERLDYLYYDIGKQNTDFKLAYTYGKKEESKFSKWLTYFEAQQKEGFLEKVNQRTQLYNEITLDLDKGDYLGLIEQLKKDELKFEAHSTDKGRCQQVHLFYSGLAELDKSDREKLKEAVIKKYGCDSAFKIDNHLVPLKYNGAKHWKTGQEIKLIEKVDGINPIGKIVTELDESTEKFNDEKLLFHIHSDLDKNHLGDHKLKMTQFTVCCTGYLEPHTLHKSMAVKANRSEGKDNLAKTFRNLYAAFTISVCNLPILKKRYLTSFIRYYQKWTDIIDFQPAYKRFIRDLISDTRRVSLVLALILGILTRRRVDKIPIMVITTKSSIKVNPLFF